MHRMTAPDRPSASGSTSSTTTKHKPNQQLPAHSFIHVPLDIRNPFHIQRDLMMVELSLPMEYASPPAPMQLPAKMAWAQLNRNHQNAAMEWFVGNQCLQLCLPQITNWPSTQLCDIPVYLRCRLSPNSKHVPVNFRSPNRLSSNDYSITFDIECLTSAQILCELENAAEINTQLDCYSKIEVSPERSTQQNGRRGGKPSQSWVLNIIIFGREGLEEKVGEYLSMHKMYLQDPLGCERCVPYRNPHIVQPDSGEIVMTSSFDSPLEDQEIERLEAGPDLLAQLMEDEISLPETDAPVIVKTDLFR